MRSHLVFIAKEKMSERFLLVQTVSRFARRIHKPNSCIGQTINRAFERVAAMGSVQEERTENHVCDLSGDSFRHAPSVDSDACSEPSGEIPATVEEPSTFALSTR